MGLDIYFSKVEKRSEILGYFRKVNFLVAFFENYYETEIRNCEDFYIGKKSVEELIDRCKRVLSAKADINSYCDANDIPENEREGFTSESVAENLLPTCPGFFFGGTEYDEYYYKDVAEVLKFCNDTLLPEFDELANDEDIIFHIWY